ncbi:hypothetical protein FRC07_003335 [Ceratobasidium sp. 392]|nr:hypothetical protein FRC07_003335 [Ceratobasidium sp. 392]
MASTRAPAPTARPAFNYDDDSEVEVIEDSEPEREERREQARIEKRRIQRAVPSSSTLGSAIHSTPSWLAPPTQPTQSTVSTSSSAVSSKPPDDDSQTLFVPIATSSAPVRPVAPPPWLVPKDAPPMPDSAIRPDPTNLQRTKHASQPSPVKQLDLNSFAFHKRTSGARTVSGSKSSRSASSSKATDTEDPSTSKVPPAPSAKSSSLSKAFHLGATNGSSTTDVTFSAGQIASITSCVVCGNSWTVRKQPKSKWTHITTCARKHGCGIDSLHLKLVAAVVEASEEKAREAAKGKEKEKEPAAPKSLLAHTVQERAPPQRRGRRKAPGPSTLRSVEEAQKSILQRSSPDLPTPAAPPTKGKSKRKPKTTSPRPPKVRTKKKTTIYAPEDVDNDEEEVTPSRDIDAQLLMIITSDQTLYLRILRYEPIKFEDIFEMALANGIPKHGLQIKLKSFLDSQLQADAPTTLQSSGRDVRNIVSKQGAI